MSTNTTFKQKTVITAPIPAVVSMVISLLMVKYALQSAVVVRILSLVMSMYALIMIHAITIIKMKLECIVVKVVVTKRAITNTM